MLHENMLYIERPGTLSNENSTVAEKACIANVILNKVLSQLSRTMRNNLKLPPDIAIRVIVRRECFESRGKTHEKG